MENTCQHRNGKPSYRVSVTACPMGRSHFSVKRCMVRVALLLSILVFSVTAFPSPSLWAYRDYLTPEQKALLDKIQIVRIEAIALTDKGTVDPAPIAELVARRMGEVEYTVVGDAGKDRKSVV